jgi:hypothetical protein
VRGVVATVRRCAGLVLGRCLTPHLPDACGGGIVGRASSLAAGADDVFRWPRFGSCPLQRTLAGKACEADAGVAHSGSPLPIFPRASGALMWTCTAALRGYRVGAPALSTGRGVSHE